MKQVGLDWSDIYNLTWSLECEGCKWSDEDDDVDNLTWSIECEACKWSDDDDDDYDDDHDEPVLVHECDNCKAMSYGISLTRDLHLSRINEDEVDRKRLLNLLMLARCKVTKEPCYMRQSAENSGGCSCPVCTSFRKVMNWLMLGKGKNG
jgi:hypothetical protein